MASINIGDNTIVLGDSTKKNYGTSIAIDNADNDLNKYIAYMDGPKLEVTYYSFYLGANTETTLLDINESENTQQYLKIRGLIIHLLDPLSTSNYSELEATGYMDIPNLVPNHNDLLIFPLLDNSVGMFVVNNVEKETYLNRGVYKITFKLFVFKSTSEDFFVNLESKVIKNFYYNKDFNSTNGSPLLLEDSYKFKKTISKVYISTLRLYLSKFVDKDTGLLYCNSSESFIDVYLEDFLLNTIDYSVLKRLGDIAEGNYDNINTNLNIYDMLKFKEIDYINSIPKYYNKIDTYTIMESVPQLRGLYFKKIKHILEYTDEATYNMGEENTASIIIPNNFRDSTIYHYVLSPDFYAGTFENISALERLILKFINNEVIDDLTDINSVLEDIPNWNNYEQYYYIPIILVLLKYTDMNVYDRI